MCCLMGFLLLHPVLTLVLSLSHSLCLMFNIVWVHICFFTNKFALILSNSFACFPVSLLIPPPRLPSPLVTPLCSFTAPAVFILSLFIILTIHCFCKRLSSHPSISSLHVVLKGPFFRFQTFMDWLGQPSPLTLPAVVPCLQRLKLVPVYGALFLAVNSVFPLSYVRTDDFLDRNFFFRYWGQRMLLQGTLLG